MGFLLRFRYHIFKLINSYGYMSSSCVPVKGLVVKNTASFRKHISYRAWVPWGPPHFCVDNSVALCLPVQENHLQSWSASSSNRPIPPIGSTRHSGLTLLRASPLRRSPSVLAIPPGVSACSATSSANTPNDPSSSHRAKVLTTLQNVIRSMTKSLLCGSKTS